MTTAAGLLETHLDALWPELVFQRVNCRPIAGTSTWSQHSWPGGNARDVFGPDMRPSEASQLLLDKVATYLRANRYRFGIKVILWRVKDHFNHIHFDPWPTGIGIPPCHGGVERYRYSDGSIIRGSNGYVPPQGIIPNLDLATTMIVKVNEAGPYVRVYQQALNSWATKQAVAGWVPIGEDGQFGPATQAAVSRYQDAAGIGGRVPLRGALDDLTRDLLERFIES